MTASLDQSLRLKATHIFGCPLIFTLVGVGAQLVDGALGMAFGVTASTLREEFLQPAVWRWVA